MGRDNKLSYKKYLRHVQDLVQANMQIVWTNLIRLSLNFGLIMVKTVAYLLAHCLNTFK